MHKNDSDVSMIHSSLVYFEMEITSLISEEALISTTSRRKRYPKKAVLRLEMIYKKNRKALKELQVKTEKRKIDLSDLNVEPSKDVATLLEVTSKKMKENQDDVINKREKVNRIVDAFKMLKNVEDAAKINEEVMSKS